MSNLRRSGWRVIALFADMKYTIRCLLFIILSVFTVTIQAIGKVPDHHLWDKLLKEYVHQGGMVDYRSLKGDVNLLRDYLRLLSENPPESIWSGGERLAYWINAYNAFTVDLVLQNYPVESINDIGSWLQIPFINSVFDINFIKIGNERMSLNDIEYKILRKEFDEPRIHFAIVCASISCPELRREAYQPHKIDEQLEEQAREFINDPTKNIISKDHLQLSKIFSWFTGDFKKQGSLIDFINRYTDIEISPDAEIDYLDYNWHLNEISTD